LLNDLLEYLQINVSEPLDVQTALACLVPSESMQKRTMAVHSIHDVPGQVLLAGREAGQEPVPFATAGIFIVILTEANDTRTLHSRDRFGCLLHDSCEDLTILAHGIVGDPAQEFLSTRGGWRGLQIGHVQSLAALA
jgi:hypothetical protein